MTTVDNVTINVKDKTLLDVWKRYIDFETFHRDSDTDVVSFIAEWNARMRVLKSASDGRGYSDVILACKLLQCINLDVDFVVDTLSSIKLPPDKGLDDVGLLSTITECIQEHSEVHKELRNFRQIDLGDSGINEAVGKSELRHPFNSKTTTSVPQGIRDNHVSDSAFSRKKTDVSSAFRFKQQEPRMIIETSEGVDNHQLPETDNERLWPQCPRCSCFLLLQEGSNSDKDYDPSSFEGDIFLCKQCNNLIYAQESVSQDIAENRATWKYLILPKCRECPKILTPRVSIRSSDNLEEDDQEGDKIEEDLLSRLVCNNCDTTLAEPPSSKSECTAPPKSKSTALAPTDNVKDPEELDSDPNELALLSMLNNEDNISFNNDEDNIKVSNDDLVNSFDLDDFQSIVVAEPAVEDDLTPEETQFIETSLGNTKSEFQCETCGKRFSCLKLVRKHKRIHTTAKRFKCEHCNKKFREARELRIHTNIHTKEKLFICSFCGRSFTRYSSLYMHTNIHTKAKTYNCKECDAKFIHHSSYVTHTRVNHTKVLPFTCEHCDKKFPIGSQLKAHMRIHSDKKTLKCKVCEKLFRHPSTLHKHMKKHIKKNETNHR